jgi:hypothetical protein
MRLVRTVCASATDAMASVATNAAMANFVFVIVFMVGLMIAVVILGDFRLLSFSNSQAI